jgi:hypothetical protein
MVAMHGPAEKGLVRAALPAGTFSIPDGCLPGLPPGSIRRAGADPRRSPIHKSRKGKELRIPG